MRRHLYGPKGDKLETVNMPLLIRATLEPHMEVRLAKKKPQ